MPYLQKHKNYARENRTNPTPAEKLAWTSILQQRPLGYKFTRQKPIGPYIVDFYCSKLKLVIEIDGDVHVHQYEYDIEREIDMKELWISTLRFTNDEVLHNRDGVYEILLYEIWERVKILWL